MTIAPSTIEEFRTAKKKISTISFNKESNYKFTISLADTIPKPYYESFFPAYMRSTNFNINILNYQIKIKTVEDPFPLGGDSSYYYYGDKLLLYIRFDEENPVFFVCNNHLDKTIEFEVLDSAVNEPYISFTAYNDFGEIKCDRINIMKIDEVIIKEFYLK